LINYNEEQKTRAHTTHLATIAEDMLDMATRKKGAEKILYPQATTTTLEAWASK